MRVLMFGWKFPPEICGGLAVVSYGIIKRLGLQGDVEATFYIPEPTGKEGSFLNIIGMNQVPIMWRDVNYDYLKSRLSTMSPEQYYALRDHVYSGFSYMHVNDLGCMDFAGGYPGNLREEINNFSIIVGAVARQQKFDIIHAHDWLTYPTGVHTKMVGSRPLCVRVHTTDFDRSRGKVNPAIYSIKKNGMDYADCIVYASELTRRTVINEYHQDPRRVFAMHSAVYSLSQELQDIPRPGHSREKVVTFLGRITIQKGSEHFVGAVALVLQHTHSIRFVMAGSGDILNAMTNLATERDIADRFHFPGFMRGKQVYEVCKNSGVFVMLSVSEPFGIAPLEAMQCETPSVISKQLRCDEVLDKMIKTDYWDIHAMADAIYSICINPSLFHYLREGGKKEVNGIAWGEVGLRVRALYEDVLGNYGR